MEQDMMYLVGAAGVVIAGAAARWWTKNRNKIADQIEETLDAVEDAIESATGVDVELSDAVEEIMEAADEVVETTVEAVESGDSVDEIVEAVTEVVEAEAEELKEDLTALTVAQLKERLKAAGLPVSGTKLTLINRLEGNE